MTLDEILQIAVAHHQAGRLAAAEERYRQILAQQPDHADALHLLGVIAAQTSRLDLAIELINRAIAAKPSAREYHSNLGKALRECGRLEEAGAAYRRAIEIKPDSAEDYQQLGNLLLRLGQLDSAISAHRQAHLLKPSQETFNDYHSALTAGIVASRQAVQGNPQDVEAHFKLGRLLREIGDCGGAVAVFGDALRISPNRPDIESESGVAHALAGDFDRALAAHHRALRLDPDFADAHFNLGYVQSETGRFDAAIASYGQAVRLKPDWAEAHWNLALALLLRGDFKRGWAEYEWRWRLPGSPSMTHNVSQPMWNGADLTGKTILLRPEQGFGDTIQLIRYAPLLARRGGRVLLMSQPELARLLECMMDVRQVPTGPQLRFELHCPLMRLPLIFGTTLDSIPANVPYLQADAQRVQAWQQKLGGHGGRLRIGLSWAGLASHRNDRNRSTTLTMLAPLAAVPNVEFYTLQKGPAAAQAKNPPAGMRLVDVTADLSDFADTAALMSHLDLIIAVDTAVVHLAGALGKPVWTMLPFKPDWRWLTEREDSPWYPTMRLFRQRTRGDWNEVIARVARELTEQLGALQESRNEGKRPK